jgi:hypothetical protein
MPLKQQSSEARSGYNQNIPHEREKTGPSCLRACGSDLMIKIEGRQEERLASGRRGG